MQNAFVEHYEKPLNVEFTWDSKDKVKLKQNSDLRTANPNHCLPLKRQSRLQQATNFASSFLILTKIRYNIS